MENPNPKTPKLYSREEVIELISKALYDINSDIELYSYPDGTTQSVNIDKWAEKNL